jgi:hypothetical protein
MGIVERAPDEMSIPGQSDVDGDVDHGPEAPNLFNDWKTFSRGGAAALRSNSSVAALFTAHDLDLPLHQEDGFRAWDYVKGTDLEPYRERFLGIRNSEAFARRAAQIRAEQKDRKFLDALPWWQRMLIEGAAGQADWTSIPLFGTLVRAANGGFSLARTAAAGAAANAGSSVAQEGMLHSIQSTRELGDSAMAIGGSAVFGGLIGLGSAAALNKLKLHGAARALERDADLAPARKVFADVERKLIDAGVPEAEARRAAAVDANRYHARAKRMNESDGDAWKMYQDDTGGAVASPKSDIERVLQGAAEPAVKPEIEKPSQGAAKQEIEKPPQDSGVEPAPKSEAEKLLHGDARGEDSPVASGPRDRIEMSPGRDEITLFRDADGPTFVQQTGRLWLADLASDAARAGAPQGLKDNAGEVLKWLGVKSADDVGPVQHSAWAQSFERYLADGKAPNAALGEAFENYRQWLVEVHRSLTQTGAPISGEVRGVMGRMLAADGDPGITPVAIGGRRAEREARAGTKDDRVSPAQGSRTGEAEAARAEGPRQESDTGPGTGNATGRVRQAADREGGGPGIKLGPQNAASRDDRAGAAGGQSRAGEAPAPATDMGGTAGILRDEGVGPSVSRGGKPDGGGKGDGRAPEGLRGQGNRPGGTRIPDEEHAGPESPAAGTEKEVTAAGPPPKPGEPPGGTSPISDPPRGRPRAASSIQEPANPTLSTKTTNGNATAQLKMIDDVHAADPDPERNAASWWDMLVRAFGPNRTPELVPEKFLRDIHGNGAVETLKRVRPEQIAAADDGLKRAAAMREAYTSGEMSVLRTGKLVLWSFLSKGRSPYPQESMFIDAFKGIDRWIEKAAKGPFTKQDLEAYEAWARSIVPRGSGRPAAKAQGNLVDFGREFLVRMSQRNAEGRTHLQRLHDLLSDTNLTGQQIRREFMTFRESSGVDNKVNAHAADGRAYRRHGAGSRPDPGAVRRREHQALWQAARRRTRTADL